MRYRVEGSDQAQEQLSRFPRDVQERMKRAIDELELLETIPSGAMSRHCRVPSGKGDSARGLAGTGSFSENSLTAASSEYQPFSSNPKTPIGRSRLQRVPRHALVKVRF
jgi:hypothetical protein